MSALAQAALFLGSSVLAVPVFRWLGLGAILGYLAAGMVIGPWGLGLVRDVESILHLGELGVVLLLFVIGLELQPRRLWALRRSVFGLGGSQVCATALFLGAGAGLMERSVSELLILTVILSMVLTPFLFIVRDRAFAREGEPKEAYDRIDLEESPVLIAGFGRFGQIIARILRAKRIGFTALEVNPDQVDFVRQYGNEIYYGDASRLELLRAANAHLAKVFVLAIDDVEASLRTAETVRRHFPNLKIYARARNRKHAYQLMDLGIEAIRRETFLSSLDLAREVLQGLGLSKRDSDTIVSTFKTHDERRLIAHHALHKDEEKMMYLAKQAAEELEELFAEDAREDETN